MIERKSLGIWNLWLNNGSHPEIVYNKGIKIEIPPKSFVLEYEGTIHAKGPVSTVPPSSPLDEMFRRRVKPPLDTSHKVFILMLTYNLLPLTKQALASVMTRFPSKIFIVDNESTDGTQQWLQEQGIEFVSQKTSVAEALNIGLRKFLESDCDYLVILNNDVVLRYDTIDSLVEALEKDDSYWIAMASEVFQTPPWGVDNVIPSGEAIEIITDIPAGAYSATALKRKVVEKVGFFDEMFTPRYIEDNDYTLRVRLAGGQHIKTSKAIYYHILGATVKAIAPHEHVAGTAYWRSNIGYFQEKWGIHPHRPQDFKKLGLEWYSVVYRKTPLEAIAELVLSLNRPAKVLIRRRMGGWGDVFSTTVVPAALIEHFGHKVELFVDIPKPYVSIYDHYPRIQRWVPGEAVDFVLDLTDVEFRVELHEVQKFNRVLHSRPEIYLSVIGAKEKVSPKIFLAEEEHRFGEEFWFGAHQPKFVIVPKASNTLKTWPWIEELVDGLEREFPSATIKILREDGKLSFRQAVSVATKADLVIGPDTGLTMASAYMGTPTVVVFGYRNGEVFRRASDKLIPVQGICSIGPCDFKLSCCQLRGSFREMEQRMSVPNCLMRLTADKVLEVIKNFMGERK